MLSTATTYLKAHHISRGKSILASMSDRFDYGQNPAKTLDGVLIRSYECDPLTADSEFLLSKARYKTITGREQKRDADVLCYQIRQSFPPGELDPEEALNIGYELAMRWTKGKHAFFVVSHADRPHPHVHIYYNSTSLDCTRKYRDFLGSARALRRLSDRVCLEHDLSIIKNPKLHSKGKFLHYGQWLGGARPPSYKEQIRGIIDGALAERPADLADFLRRMEAAGVQAVIDGRAPVRKPAQARPRPAAPRRVNLIIDIQQRMAQGKGPGYERWAKIYNLKQMAAALQFLQENGLTDYDALAERTAAAVDRAHALAGELRGVEERLASTTKLMGAVVDYAKTRPVFDGYKAARYGKKYLAEHEEALASYRAAKAAINDILDGVKLPKMDALKKERRELAERKKKLYAQYRAAQQEMREAVAVKANVDHLLDLPGGRESKARER